MANQDERLVTFYIEHYRQMNDALRYTERNTQVVAGWYLTLTAGILGFIFSTDTTNSPTWWLYLFLFVVGILVAWYVSRARYWHCEHTEVAKAIHRMFFNKDLELLKAAKQVVNSNKEMKWSFFNWRGAEFSIYVLVLLVTMLNGVVFLKSWSVTGKWWILLILCAIVLGVGVWRYRGYLEMKEKDFPINSPFIIHNEDAISAVKTGEQKEGHSDERVK